MSHTINPSALASALQETGNGWILRSENRDAILNGIAGQIEEFVAEYERRFGETPDPLAMLRENPDKAAAFFETYAAPTLSLDMRVMVWRIINGARILSASLSYRHEDHLQLHFELSSDGPSDAEKYSSHSLWDYHVLRHIGLLALGERPVLYGYFPLGRA